MADSSKPKNPAAGGGGFNFDFSNPAPATVIRCPVCKSTDFRAWSNQYGVQRKCNKCGNEWSGGALSVAKPDERLGVPPPGVPAPDDDLPAVQYNGAGFRDPYKNTGGDDDY